MAWLGTRSTTVRRRGAVAATAVAAIATALGAAVPSPARAQDAGGEDPGGDVRAFLVRDGRPTAFGARDDDVAIYPSGVNDRGEVVGLYLDADGAAHGFLLDGRPTPRSPPPAPRPPSRRGSTTAARSWATPPTTSS